MNEAILKANLRAAARSASEDAVVELRPVKSGNGRFLDLEIVRKFEIRGQARESIIRIPGNKAEAFLRDVSKYIQEEWAIKYREFLVERDRQCGSDERFRKIGTHKHRTTAQRNR